MNLDELIEEIGTIVADSSLQSFYMRWINEAILEIAADFPLPALRLNDPIPLVIATSSWLYIAPATYQKQLFRAADSDFNRIRIMRDLDALDGLDLDHDDIGDHVTHLATRDRTIGVYPKAAETINLWFYKKPASLDNGTHVPTCIPESYHSRVIIPKVVVKNFRALQDMVIAPPHQSILFWQKEYLKGLNGEPRGDIGMLNFLGRERKPRRHCGKDPVGWRFY
jgi:hypothetical protein